jgi:uncharacterized protein (DUF111 family)
MERLWMIQADIDDASGELLAAFADSMRQDCVLDVVLLPTLMKKGRPGVRLEVLATADQLDHARARILRETPTLGVRAWEVERIALAREVEQVGVFGHPVRVKLAQWEGRPIKAKAEHEDLALVAEETGRPLAEVAAAAQAAIHRRWFS